MMLPGLYDNHVHAGVGRGALMEWEGGLISEVPAWVREALRAARRASEPGDIDRKLEAIRMAALHKAPTRRRTCP